MTREIIISLVIGATIPIITNWLNAALKFHYNGKSEMKPILREEVRSYFLYKPHLRSAYSDINQINNTDFGSEVLKHSIDDLRKSVEKLESIPLENVPIEIFGDFYEVLGEMQYVSKTGSDILLTKKHSVHLRNAVKNEVYPDIEMKLDRLIDNYSEYIDTAIQKLK